MNKYIFLLLLLWGNKSITYDYDLIIIGAGAAGFNAISLARKYNKKIAVIEKNKLGGTYIWTADIPSKTLVYLANLAYKIRNLQKEVFNQITFPYNSDKIFQYIKKVRNKISEQFTTTYFHEKEIDIFSGIAQFKDRHTVTIDNNQTLTANNFIIATGSLPRIPKLEGIQEIDYLTPDNFFEQDQLPPSICIIGGGSLGIEMATALNGLGVKVFLVMKRRLILPTCDFEFIEKQMERMTKDGITLLLNTVAIKAEQINDTICITCQDKQNNLQTVYASKIFFATNRTPNIKNLNLQEIGIKLTKSGAIAINKKMQTSVPNIYACGDVTGQHLLLSRIAYSQAKIAVYNAFCPFWKKRLEIDLDNIVNLVYTSPLLCAWVGISEQHARKEYGNSIVIKKYGYSMIPRAQIENEIEGIIKLVYNNNILIGAHILGKNAGEIIQKIKINEPFNLQFSKYLFKIPLQVNYSDILYTIANAPDLNLFTTNFFSHYFNKLKKMFF